MRHIVKELFAPHILSSNCLLL